MIVKLKTGEVFKCKNRYIDTSSPLVYLEILEDNGETSKIWIAIDEILFIKKEKEDEIEK